ncbi:MAG: DUF2791 family P-loop domain-containing protein [Chloroflexi bacterium]|nr:DUF2791 family P-loop domain-containing protein [Chloroflexota bacterium]
MKLEAKVQSRRAIEALRSGVPNRDAVHALGSSQPDIEAQFRKQLAVVKDGLQQGTAHAGTIIVDDFGSGKSHLLEHLQDIALGSNFVCSKVVISKETPLYDLAKLYRAAIDSAQVPDRVGAGLTAVVARIDFNTPPYAHFYQWVNRSDSKLSTQFAATVFILQHSSDPEVTDRIIQFWSGNKLYRPELRGWLGKLKEGATYKMDKVSDKELARQRYSFAAQLMGAAGYAGWVVLIDEVELMGKYSLRQRAKSYAQIARLMGKLEGENIAGLASVLSITEDFEEVVLLHDEERIPGRLRGGGSEEELLLASQAESGMRMIRDRWEHGKLARPSEATIAEIYAKVQAIYSQAYEWAPPSVYQTHHDWRIRQHIKRWINEWDLRRLYPDYTPEIEVSDLRHDYSEQPELGQSSEDSPDESGGNL